MTQMTAEQALASKNTEIQSGQGISALPDVIIGKDILELLSSSMYVNPLTIYREYIQNAADAIDDAVGEGCLDRVEDGRIDISLDHIGRRVVIRDNGAGLSGDEFVERMTAFGASHKRGTNARGFRGVGRLAGLGYCQKLIFRSRSHGDRKVSEISWDCRTLKNLLLDSSFDGALSDIVKRVISVKRIDDHDLPSRFFEVEIVTPRRIGQDDLLNEQIIQNYVGQVAPVAFHPEFRFASEIREHLSESMVPLGEYAVHINGGDIPIYRPFRNEIEYSDTKTGAYEEVEPLRIESLDGKLAATGWIMHHDYQGAIPRNQGVRGLRARVGNIQIGDSRIFSDAFPEHRFNSWTVGEVHVLDQRISPNGRRDNFESNTHLFNLTDHLAPYTYHIARKCRSSSQIRARIRTFENAERNVLEAIDFIEQGAISKQTAMELRKNIGTRLAEMAHAASFKLLPHIVQSELDNRFAIVKERISLIEQEIHENRALKTFSKQKQEIYHEVFDLIYDCSNNRSISKTLIDRILKRISHTNG